MSNLREYGVHNGKRTTVYIDNDTLVGAKWLRSKCAMALSHIVREAVKRELALNEKIVLIGEIVDSPDPAYERNRLDPASLEDAQLEKECLARWEAYRVYDRERCRRSRKAQFSMSPSQPTGAEGRYAILWNNGDRSGFPAIDIAHARNLAVAMDEMDMREMRHLVGPNGKIIEDGDS